MPHSHNSFTVARNGVQQYYRYFLTTPTRRSILRLVCGRLLSSFLPRKAVRMYKIIRSVLFVLLFTLAGQRTRAQCIVPSHTQQITCHSNGCSDGQQFLVGPTGYSGYSQIHTQFDCCGVTYNIQAASVMSCQTASLRDPALHQKLIQLAQSHLVFVAKCNGAYEMLRAPLRSMVAPSQIDLDDTTAKIALTL